MPPIVALVLFVALVVVAFVMWRRRMQHKIAAARVPAKERADHVRVMTGAPLEYWWESLLPWVLGILALGLTSFIVPSMGWFFAAAVAILFWVVGYLIRVTLVGNRALKLEVQLAAAIDHIVTSLHAGLGVMDALTGAERDTKQPLESYLAQFILRIRLGDNPPEVCREMADMVPLESFRLFFYALGVQWEGGGNLAPTLATTGKFIRDRVELGRRVRAQSTEARVSVIMILGLTYGLAYMMYNMDPGRVAGFLGTGVGKSLVSASIVLQAIGAAWISKMAKIKY